MVVFPNAKINLGLNIVEKRSDGYHNLNTVFYPIPLEDALEVCVNGEGRNGECRLFQAGIAIEGSAEDNLVVKAYRLLHQHYDLPPVTIHLLKHIPTGAGLGGGSSDAAFMLRVLNERFSLQLSHEELEKYARSLGADCPFFIRNTPVYAEGIGDLFSPLSLSLAGYVIVVVKPDVFVSTRDAFSHITPRQPEHPLLEIVAQPVETWRDFMKNDFEESVFPLHPRLGEIKEQLYDAGAIYASMSGSGSSLFGLFRKEPSLPDWEGCQTYVHELRSR